MVKDTGNGFDEGVKITFSIILIPTHILESGVKAVKTTKVVAKEWTCYLMSITQHPHEVPARQANTILFCSDFQNKMRTQ